MAEAPLRALAAVMATLTIAGNGEPLVLLPGLDGTGLLFHRQVPSLARRYRVASLRLPDDVDRMESLVARVHAAIGGLVTDGGRVALLGESFGGALAMSYALAHPARVSRLIVLNSFARIGARARLWLGYHLLRAMPWGMMPLVRHLTTRRMHSPHTTPEDVRRYHVLMRNTTRDGYLSRLAMLRRYDIRDELPRLATPTLFLAADRDRLVPSVDEARFMAARVPRAAVRILPGHGHICLLAPDFDLLAILDEWTAETA